VAGLKKAAAAKAKQLAIRKGLQCLKNGLSNFCNGKKKGSVVKNPKIKIKPKIGSISGITKTISNSKVTNNPKSTNNAKGTNNANTRPTSSITKKVGKQPLKPLIKKISGPTISKLVPKCTNIFDSLANKVNNITRHVADKTVNKGRDWLKKNIGGDISGCSKQISTSKGMPNGNSKGAKKIMTKGLPKATKKITNKGRPKATKKITTKTKGTKKGPKKNKTPKSSNLRGSSSGKRNKVFKSPTSIRRQGNSNAPSNSQTDDSLSGPPQTNSGSDDALTSSTVPRTPVVKRHPIKRKPVITTRPTNTNTNPNDDNSNTIRTTKRPVIKRKPVITSRPTNSIPVPISTTDDKVITSRPTKRRPIRRRTHSPVIKTDDTANININTNTFRPTIAKIGTDDTVSNSSNGRSSTAKPSQKRIRQPKNNRIPKSGPPSSMPTFTLAISFPPTRRPATQTPTTRPSTQTPTTRLPTTKPSTQTPTTRLPTTKPSTQTPTTRKPTFVPTRIPTTRIPTQVPTTRPPTLKPSFRPLSPPTMIPISWAVFSSAPTIFTNIPPTVFPTMSMFGIITNFPTISPTPKPIFSLFIPAPTRSPTPNSVAQTPSPTLIPSQTPSQNPTEKFSLQPTQTPTQLPSQLPTQSPSQPDIGLLSANTKSSTGQTNTSSTAVIAAVASVVVVLMIIVAFICLNRAKSGNKKSPFEIWTEHYANSNKEIPNLKQRQSQTTNIINDDIHHFYHKSPTPNIVPKLNVVPLRKQSRHDIHQI
jgi:hypothetical protein